MSRVGGAAAAAVGLGRPHAEPASTAAAHRPRHPSRIPNSNTSAAKDSFASKLKQGPSAAADGESHGTSSNSLASANPVSLLDYAKASKIKRVESEPNMARSGGGVRLPTSQENSATPTPSGTMVFTRTPSSKTVGSEPNTLKLKLAQQMAEETNNAGDGAGITDKQVQPSTDGNITNIVQKIQNIATNFPVDTSGVYHNATEIEKARPANVSESNRENTVESPPESVVRDSESSTTSSSPLDELDEDDASTVIDSVPDNHFKIRSGRYSYVESPLEERQGNTAKHPATRIEILTREEIEGNRPAAVANMSTRLPNRVFDERIHSQIHSRAPSRATSQLSSEISSQNTTPSVNPHDLAIEANLRATAVQHEWETTLQMASEPRIPAACAVPPIGPTGRRGGISGPVPQPPPQHIEIQRRQQVRPTAKTETVVVQDIRNAQDELVYMLDGRAWKMYRAPNDNRMLWEPAGPKREDIEEYEKDSRRMWKMAIRDNPIHRIEALTLADKDSTAFGRVFTEEDHSLFVHDESKKQLSPQDPGYMGKVDKFFSRQGTLSDYSFPGSPTGEEKPISLAPGAERKKTTNTWPWSNAPELFHLQKNKTEEVGITALRAQREQTRLAQRYNPHPGDIFRNQIAQEAAWYAAQARLRDESNSSQRLAGSHESNPTHTHRLFLDNLHSYEKAESPLLEPKAESKTYFGTDNHLKTHRRDAEPDIATVRRGLLPHHKHTSNSVISPTEYESRTRTSTISRVSHGYSAPSVLGTEQRASAGVMVMPGFQSQGRGYYSYDHRDPRQGILEEDQGYTGVRRLGDKIFGTGYQ